MARALRAAAAALAASCSANSTSKASSSSGVTSPSMSAQAMPCAVTDSPSTVLTLRPRFPSCGQHPTAMSVSRLARIGIS
ncbi:hypothetical protein [Mycolicibacterium boenickei]|uniref:hypothetical protein n=1 Tax=Mycolicibacterium boenickei TaxID=146017 RepID=UPI0013A572C1|nr:hypothetical protein [Mycolicibacterium boenickei]